MRLDLPARYMERLAANAALEKGVVGQLLAKAGVTLFLCIFPRLAYLGCLY